MKEIIYLIWAVLEKSLLIAFLAFVLWIFWVVPNDLRRARNTALFSFALLLIICGYFGIQETRNASDEISAFRGSIEKSSIQLDALTTQKVLLEDTLLQLRYKLNAVFAEKDMLYQIISERKKESRISELYSPLLKRINELENQLYKFRAKVDSSIFQCNAIAFKDSTKIMTVVSLRKLNNYDHLDYYRPSLYAKEIQYAQNSVIDRSQNLLTELRRIQKGADFIENEIISLREELLGNIKIVFIDSDFKVLR